VKLSKLIKNIIKETKGNFSYISVIQNKKSKWDVIIHYNNSLKPKVVEIDILFIDVPKLDVRIRNSYYGVKEYSHYLINKTPEKYVKISQFLVINDKRSRV
jgi:hypothetical protein